MGGKNRGGFSRPQSGWLAYMLPESRAAMMLAISDARLSATDDRDIQLAGTYCSNELFVVHRRNYAPSQQDP